MMGRAGLKQLTIELRMDRMRQQAPKTPGTTRLEALRRRCRKATSSGAGVF